MVVAGSPPDAPSNGGPKLPVTIVGIGASAGGLRALQQLVEAVPADSGMAYVVILHLDPQRKSRMQDLLQDRARIPVLQVTATTEVQVNHVYVIPPGHDLLLNGSTLELRARGERSDHAPVDLFFRTLAEACGADAIGVVLSGTGVDGTAGIRYIREAGGITVAQSPDESEYDGMPASAISTGLVDLVLPSARIPAELARLRKRPKQPVTGAGDTAYDAEELGRVFATLRSRTGHDFTQYKRTTVLRRLDRRLRFNDVTTLADYLPLLEASTTECQALLRDLLISVSSFFRDAEAFDALAERLPGLFEGRGPEDSVRVWVVGCATGEEVYSIAMVLAEYASTLKEPPRVQLFATDIDEHGYGWARAGLYSAAAVQGITPDRLQRFFTREAGGYRVVKSLRELVLFAGHNVLHDPPFSRMDIISCRNLFIYLQPEAQARVLETFHFSTNPDGFLFLGASETVGDGGLFQAIDGNTHRLFRRSESPHRLAPRVSAADPVAGFRMASGPPEPPGTTASPRQRFSYGALHVRMLEQYAPASVIVNERLDVVHVSEGAGRFLRLQEGEPSHKLLSMAEEGLRRVLRTALHHAFAEGAHTTRTVSMTLDGEARQVGVQVRPSDRGPGSFALIVFNEDGATAPSSNGSGEGDDELEEELRRTRDTLEATSAAHDRIVAELQLVNEELQSINEEQKAATEELETGREEIQSINEELTTINQEHQSTIEELKRTNGDLQNLIESTEIGTIFLDRTMRVRRFTPAAGALFNFVPTDRGRPLAHITHSLKYDELMEDVGRVLTSLERVEREVESNTGAHYIARINPYRSAEGASEGAVLTFFDNTAQFRIRSELEKSRLAAESADLAKGTFLSTLSHEFRTPLNGILGYADLLQLEGGLSDRQALKVERIKVGGWHLAAMIDEILSFAKLDGGREGVEAESVDARLIAREAGALVEQSAEDKGLRLVVEVPEEPVTILTDPGKTRQILINLCGNAVKYTQSGEVRLRLGAGAGRVWFDVEDTGIGIAAEHLERVFDRFWQVDGASTRAAGGMGIGLAAAREYARLLQGDVEVTSEPGQGTTFRLWLPDAYEAASPVAAGGP